MKKIIQFSAVLLLLVSAACSNDFALTTDWKSIPVVYSILDGDSETHYVRVEKAFIDPEKSALEIAKIPDSLYFDDASITVYLERVSNGDRFDMFRVDGNDEGFERPTGIFADKPNWLYKTTATLSKTEEYRVVVERSDNLPTAQATVQVPGEFSIIQPFAGTDKLGFFADGESSFQFNTDVTASRFNLTILFTFRDLDITTNTVTRDTLSWLAITDARSFESNPTFGVAEVPGIRFYEFLNANVAPAATNHVRFLEKGYIILEGGGVELGEFEVLADANSGITGAETVPFYTNVENGYGLVLAKGTSITEEYFWNTAMIDEMESHPLTAALNFRY